MSNWLMKHGVQGEGRMPAIVEFVCDFAPNLIHKWDDYLTEQNCPCWQVIYDIDDLGMQAYWISCAVGACVGLATDYYRRVVLACRSYPLNLMWLIQDPLEKRVRSGVCSYVTSSRLRLRKLLT